MKKTGTKKAKKEAKALLLDMIFKSLGSINTRVIKLEDQARVLDKGTMNPERLDGVGDSEEVGFIKLELTLSEAKNLGAIVSTTGIPVSFSLRFKLNKMLKNSK